MDPQHPLQRGVVPRKIGGTNRPCGHPIRSLDTNEILIREAQGDATPGEAAPTHLKASGPEERPVRRMAVGVQPFIGIKPGIGFPIAGVLGLQTMAATAEPRQPSHRIGGFRPQCRLRRQIRPCIDQQDPSTTFSQGQGSHATAGP